jgi:hypothetical protein
MDEQDDEQDQDVDVQYQRIAGILGEEVEPPGVEEETLATYLDYLKKRIEMPCLLTGIEPFDWEERFTFGPGSKKEYEKLKVENASSTDTFELIALEEEVNEDYGIIVQVKRTSDGRRFELPLADLETKDEKSRNHELLDDYSVWFVNFR